MAEENKESGDDYFSNEPEDNFIGGFNYGKLEYSQPILAMEAVRDCRIKRAEEMKAGYWNIKFDKDGNAHKIWIKDARKVYIGTVIGFELLMTASFDSDYKDARKELEEELGKHFKEYAYESIAPSPESQHKFIRTGNFFIPEIDEEIMIFNPNQERLIPAKGFWNVNVNLYWNECQKTYDKVFAELNNLLARTKYFKKKTKFG